MKKIFALTALSLAATSALASTATTEVVDTPVDVEISVDFMSQSSDTQVGDENYTGAVIAGKVVIDNTLYVEGELTGMGGDEDFKNVEFGVGFILPYEFGYNETYSLGGGFGNFEGYQLENYNPREEVNLGDFLGGTPPKYHDSPADRDWIVKGDNFVMLKAAVEAPIMDTDFEIKADISFYKFQELDNRTVLTTEIVYNFNENIAASAGIVVDSDNTRGLAGLDYNF